MFGATNWEDAYMAPLVSGKTDAESLGLSTPITAFMIARDHEIAVRRRALAAETTDLFDMARRQALLRWRGLAPEHRAS